MSPMSWCVLSTTEMGLKCVTTAGCYYPLIQEHQIVVYIMFVNSLPMVVTILWNLKFGTVGALKDRN